MTEREKERLKALREADEALYRLWKKSVIGEPLFYEVSKLQENFIHPEIRKLAPPFMLYEQKNEL